MAPAFIWYHVAAATAASSNEMGWIPSSSDFRPPLLCFHGNTITLPRVWEVRRGGGWGIMHTG